MGSCCGTVQPAGKQAGKGQNTQQLDDKTRQQAGSLEMKQMRNGYSEKQNSANQQAGNVQAQTKNMQEHPTRSTQEHQTETRVLQTLPSNTNSKFNEILTVRKQEYEGQTAPLVTSGKEILGKTALIDQQQLFMPEKDILEQDIQLEFPKNAIQRKRSKGRELSKDFEKDQINFADSQNGQQTKQPLQSELPKYPQANIIEDSLDNFEQILQSRLKNNDKSNSMIRQSIHMESQVQFGSSNLQRNDVFVFNEQNKQKNQLKPAKYNSEIYFTFNEKESRAYFLQRKKQQNDIDPKNAYSSFQDWSKLTEKYSAQYQQRRLEKDAKIAFHPFADMFQQIVSLKERAWYMELASFYKEKNQANKANINMQETVFYKKLVTINEHFRLLVNSVSNTVFNNQFSGSMFEYPPQQTIYKKRKTSNAGSRPSSSERSENPLEPIPLKSYSSQVQQSSQPQYVPSINPRQQIASSAPSTPFVSLIESMCCENLPEAYSPRWLLGLIWKGVYFRLVSKNKSKSIKREIKALKHIGVEFLQGDFSFKINNVGSPQPVFVNYVLPLICYVETASFVLYATPVNFTQDNTFEESIIRQSGFSLRSPFINHPLLSNLKETNLRFLQKPQEGGNPNQISGITYIIQNAQELLPQQAESVLMFPISQDANNPIQFQQAPKEGIIDIGALKTALDFNDKEFKFQDQSSNQLKLDKIPQQNGIGSFSATQKFDQVSFKKHGWSFKMVSMPQQDSKQNFINRRATELLSTATKKSKEINSVYGNVLIFAKLSSKDAMILPQLLCSVEDSQMLNIHNTIEQVKNLSSYQELKDNRERKLLQIYQKQILLVVKDLETSDAVVNSKSLGDLFHRHGLNLRFQFLVYSLLKTPSSKAIVGCDILSRALKTIVTAKTSTLIAKFIKTAELEINQQKNSLSCISSPSQIGTSAAPADDSSSERNDIFADILFRNVLNRLLVFLLKGDQVRENYLNCFFIFNIAIKGNDDRESLTEIIESINLRRLKSIPFISSVISQEDKARFLSNAFIKEIISLAQQNASLFLQSISLIFGITFSAELNHNIRNDKYYFLIRNSSPKASDISLIHYVSVPYLSVKEIAYLFYIKSSHFKGENQAKIYLPSALYKIADQNSNETNTGILQSSYFLPNGETLKDIVSFLSCIFGNLSCLESENSFFLDFYIYQLFDSLFLGNEDEEIVKTIMNEKIQPFLSNTYALQAELFIVVYTLRGVLQETKSLLECEQSYIMALLSIHRLYGDPRGRGNQILPWELFILWRIGIVARLQGKKHDAEYIEELYDSVQFSMQQNTFNSFKFQNSVYQNPFSTQQKFAWENKNATTRIPFSHWTEYQNLNENSPMLEVLCSTLKKNSDIFTWLMNNLPSSKETGILWETRSLSAFQLSIMQKQFHPSSSCSSVSGSVDKGESTPKSQKGEYFNKQYSTSNQSGSIVQILEKDNYTFSKKESVGVMFTWGQNTQGQMGNVFADVNQAALAKKIKVNYPKLVVPLKDVIITSVACGYQHSVAITYYGNVLAWGDNSHSQLGLGEGASTAVFYPSPIPDLNKVVQVSCGSEHTLALDSKGSVFSWGNGEGGLLGHGDEQIQSSPKIIEALESLGVEFITCGGLHSLVLTKNRQIYSWGRNEGGQLGLEKKYFTSERSYLTSPLRVRGLLDGVGVIQIAAGEAHSLALALNGQVYGWGYNMSGQIGLGHQQDYPSYEPQLVPRLNKIEKIYSGQTFSMFMNQNKEILCCGLNDSNQLGLEKEPIKITKDSLLDQYKPPELQRGSPDVFIPKKMDCFNQIPVLHVSCGHNHSLALVVVDTKHYMLFSWGMNKHGQLGIGETGSNNSIPRPITYLQDVTTYSMACGSYHSLVVANDINRILKKDSLRLIQETLDKYDSKWNFVLAQNKKEIEIERISDVSRKIESAVPPEEGRIDNSKIIQRPNQFNALGVKFS